MAPRPLDYAPPDRRLSKRRWLRRSILLMILGILCGAAFRFGPPAWQRYKTWRDQRQDELNYTLLMAAFDGDEAKVRRALRQGANPNVDLSLLSTARQSQIFASDAILTPTGTPLFSLAQHAPTGSLRIARMLVDAGADVNYSFGTGDMTNTALYWATRRKDEALALYLIERGANVNAAPQGGTTFRDSPLHCAVTMPKVVRAMIEKGADVNLRIGNNSGTAPTPLGEAVDADILESVDLLLQAGADPDIANSSGNPPLYSAAQNGNEQIVKRLLAAHANPNATGDLGRTALAADHLTVGCAKLLLDAGANPNAAMNLGTTPLHIAALRGEVDLAKLLIRAGATVNAADNDGNTPLDYATTQTMRHTLLKARTQPKQKDSSRDR
jgi:ankyrin repeat protein